MSHEPQLLPDSTIWIQMALFLTSYFVLKILVFRPYLALLKLRHDKTTGLKEKAAADSERAEKLHADYEAFMKAERKKVGTWLEDQRKAIADEERQIIQQARTAVGEELQTLRKKIQAEMDTARTALAPLVSEYSSLIATKLMGRQVKISASVSETSRPSGEETRV